MDSNAGEVFCALRTLLSDVVHLHGLGPTVKLPCAMAFMSLWLPTSPDSRTGGRKGETSF